MSNEEDGPAQTVTPSIHHRLMNELPPIIGYPLMAIDFFMRQIVILSGFLMAFAFGAVVVVRYGFGGDLFA